MANPYSGALYKMHIKCPVKGSIGGLISGGGGGGIDRNRMILFAK